jgi:hypothetical protein
LQHARELLSVDAAAKDIGTECRRKARAMLADLPIAEAEALTVRDATRDEAEAFAKLLNLGKWRAEFATLLARLRVTLDHAAGNADVYVGNAVSFTRDALTQADKLAALGKRCGRTIPRDVARLVAAARVALPGLEQAKAIEERAANVQRYEQARANFAVALAGSEHYQTSRCIDTMRAEARRLAATDSDAERDARTAEVDNAVEAYAAMVKRDAPAKARAALDGAALAVSEKRYGAAQSLIHEAVRHAGAMPEDDARADALAEANTLRERNEAQQAAALADAPRAWRAGEIASVPRGADTGRGVLLRLSRDGRAVETSEGATVPVTAARMLWRLVARCARTGNALRTPPPVRVGHFHLSHIEANGDATVGCHFIAYEEAHLFALSQRWTDTDSAQLLGDDAAAIGGAA